MYLGYFAFRNDHVVACLNTKKVGAKMVMWQQKLLPELVIATPQLYPSPKRKQNKRKSPAPSLLH